MLPVSRSYDSEGRRLGLLRRESLTLKSTVFFHFSFRQHSEERVYLRVKINYAIRMQHA